MTDNKKKGNHRCGTSKNKHRLCLSQVGAFVSPFHHVKDNNNIIQNQKNIRVLYSQRHVGTLPQCPSVPIRPLKVNMQQKEPRGRAGSCFI